MIRLLQISDLHFCESELARSLSSFSRAIADVPLLGPKLQLEIDFARPEVLAALGDLISSLDPDGILICGDITTFGDSKSFANALEWLKPHLLKGNGKTRSCLVVPGNHDALQHHLAYLRNVSVETLPWYARKSMHYLFRKAFSHLDPFLARRGEEAGDGLNAFREFVSQHAAIHNKTVELPFDSHSRVVIFPFSSLSTDSLWMNLGVARNEEWVRLRHALQSPQASQAGALKILMIHHNPISTPDQVETNVHSAYNSMPGGTQFLQTIQRMGVDLVLHGHQHADAAYSFDFDLENSSHAFTIGVPSASCGSSPAVNLLELGDINHATVSRFKYADHVGFTKPASGAKTLLNFERNRPIDAPTRTARLELKRYSYQGSPTEDEQYWDTLLNPGADFVYVSGRHLKTIRESRFEAIRKLLDHSPNCRVRVLVSRPALLTKLAQATETDDHIKNLWGTREQLANLAKTSQEALDGFREFLRQEGGSVARRVDVRVAHTILPFAAVARDPARGWGRLGVRLLPVGAVGDISAPVVGLNCRSDKAFYQYYLTYLRYLFLRGETVLGDWDGGETDLTDGLDADLMNLLRATA